VKTKCPLINKECIQHQCEWYIQIMGKNPNTGEDLNKFGCAISWLPVLLIENAKEVRQGAAAVESFRNEMVNDNAIFNKLLMTKVQENKKLENTNGGIDNLLEN